jgi:hypothetical protein
LDGGLKTYHTNWVEYLGSGAVVLYQNDYTLHVNNLVFVEEDAICERVLHKGECQNKRQAFK